MSVGQEFKEFILRGNVIDMSVGIIVGAAFSKLVDSAVKDILMPPLGLLMGKVDFSNLFITLSDGNVPGPYHTLDLAKVAGAVTLNVGLFINTMISLVIVGFAVFLLVKAINALRRVEAPVTEALAEETKECPRCYSKVALKATRCPFCTSDIQVL